MRLKLYCLYTLIQEKRHKSLEEIKLMNKYFHLMLRKILNNLRHNCFFSINIFILFEIKIKNLMIRFQFSESTIYIFVKIFWKIILHQINFNLVLRHNASFLDELPSYYVQHYSLYRKDSYCFLGNLNYDS